MEIPDELIDQLLRSRAIFKTTIGIRRRRARQSLLGMAKVRPPDAREPKARPLGPAQPLRAHNTCSRLSGGGSFTESVRATSEVPNVAVRRDFDADMPAPLRVRNDERKPVGVAGIRHEVHGERP